MLAGGQVGVVWQGEGALDWESWDEPRSAAHSSCGPRQVLSPSEPQFPLWSKRKAPQMSPEARSPPVAGLNVGWARVFPAPCPGLSGVPYLRFLRIQSLTGRSGSPIHWPRLRVTMEPSMDCV